MLHPGTFFIQKEALKGYTVKLVKLFLFQILIGILKYNSRFEPISKLIFEIDDKAAEAQSKEMS